MFKGIRAINESQYGSQYMCTSCRNHIWNSVNSRANEQKRWITRRHIQKIKDAAEDWTSREKAVEEGTKQSMLSLLEERGYINQIIGSVISIVMPDPKLISSK